MLLLVTFAYQGYIAGTHIHGAFPGDRAALNSSLLASIDKATAYKTPVLPSDGSADCPYCQAVVHAGAFFMPAVGLTFLVMQSFAFTVFSPPKSVTRLHSVMSARPRAPPVS
jgi:hypothetical protein